MDITTGHTHVSPSRGPYTASQPRPVPTAGAPFCTTQSILILDTDTDPAPRQPAPALADILDAIVPIIEPAPFRTTSVLRYFARRLRKRINVHEFGWRDVEGFHQHSRCKLKRHYAASYAQFVRSMGGKAPGGHPDDFIRELSSGRIQRAGGGREKLYVRSRWAPDEDGVVRVLVRIDLDHKHGEPDHEALIAWAKRLFSNAWWCECGGYFWLTIRPIEGDDGRLYYPLTKRKVNELLVRLHEAIGRAVKAAGFIHITPQQRAEIKGGFSTSTTETDENGMQAAPTQVGNLNGGFTARIPVLPPGTTKANVDAIFDSHGYSCEELETIISSCPPPEESVEEKVARITAACDQENEEDGEEQVPARWRGQRRCPARDPQTLSKPAQYWFAAASAVREMKLSSRQAIGERTEAVIRRANTIYIRECGGDADFDADRHQSLASALQKVISTFDPQKIAKPKEEWKEDVNWWTDETDGDDNDLLTYLCRLDSWITRDQAFADQLSQVNKIQQRRGHPQVSIRHLAVCHLTMMKNIHQQMGEAPHKAVLMMFRSGRHQLPAAPSTVTMCLRLLTGRTLVVVGDAVMHGHHEGTWQRTKGRCRRWKIMEGWSRYDDDHGVANALGHNPKAFAAIQGALSHLPPAAAANGTNAADSSGGYLQFSSITWFNVEAPTVVAHIYDIVDEIEAPNDAIEVEDDEFEALRAENGPFVPRPNGVTAPLP